jgi:hypothetical protein
MTPGTTGDWLFVFDALRVLHHAHADGQHLFLQAEGKQHPADNQASQNWSISKIREPVLCRCCTMLMPTVST